MKKYIFANIILPIEINEDGTMIPLPERITMDFSNCDELPPICEENINYTFLTNNLPNFFENNTQLIKVETEKQIEVESEKQIEPSLLIEKKLILNQNKLKKILANTTFKQKSHSKQYTAKKH
jgi:hypothetical protein